MTRKILSIALKIAVSAGILYLLFSGIDGALVWRIFSSINAGLLVLAALIYISTQCISTLRWSMILDRDFKSPYLKLLSIYYIGMFFNNFLPTMVGGDVVKGYYLYRATGRADVSISSIFMDRYSGFLALMVITAVALIPGYALIRGTTLPFFFVLLLGGFFVISLAIWAEGAHGWAVSIFKKIRLYGLNEKIDRLYGMLMSYKKNYSMLVKVFLCSLYVQAGVIIGYYALGTALGMDVSIGHYFLFIPLTTAISMLPVSLSGLGIREGAFVYFFSKAGASNEAAITLSLTWFAITALTSLLGGIEYIRSGAPKQNRIEGLKNTQGT